jgi:predicted Co/Zn/Cd cation transporter (cation efflux family)
MQKGIISVSIHSMSRWAKTSICSFGVFIVGSFIGMASGAIGICGDGGWGLVPAFLGMLALAVFVVSLPVLPGRAIYRKWYMND